MNMYVILLSLGAIVLILWTIADRKVALKALEPGFLETLDKKFWQHGQYALSTPDDYEHERVSMMNRFIFFTILKTFVAAVCILASNYRLLG